MQLADVVEISVDRQHVSEDVVENQRFLARMPIVWEQSHHAIAVLEARELGGQVFEAGAIGGQIPELGKLN